MSQLLRSAISLGASPLIIGSLVYFLWRLTRWSFLEMMGLMTLLIGFIAFLGGAVCLIAYLKHETRNRTTPQRSLIVRALIVGGLLIANFPMAAFYTSSAIDISTRYTVRVYNESNLPIESFIISGPGIEHEFGPIPVRKNALYHFYPNASGTLEFAGRQEKINFHGELEGYVHKGAEGDKTVKVSGKGLYEITDNLH